MSINVYTEYDRGQPYCVFDLQEFDTQVAKFLLKLGFEKLSKFKYRISTQKYAKQQELNVRVMDIAGYQLNKLIKITDRQTSFTNLKYSKNYLTLEDGYLCIGYDHDMGRVVQGRMNGYDLTQVAGYFTDLGFKVDKERSHTGFRAFKAVCTCELLNKLVNDGYVKVSDEILKPYRDLVVLRHRLMRDYLQALKGFEYYGEFKLLDHQANYIRKALTWGSILAFDMGCGKTFTSLYQVAIYASIMELKVVVVCPKSVRTQWEVAAYEHFGMHISTCTWSSMPKPVDKPYVVIFDECHYMAEHTSARSEAALVLASRAIAVLALSGTVTKNGRASELFNILKCVGYPEVSKDSYIVKYGWDSITTRMPLIAKDLKDKYFYVSKKEVLDLPKKMRTKHVVELTPVQQEVYHAKFAEFMKRYDERVRLGMVSSSNRTEYLVALQGLRLGLAVAKAEHTASLVSMLVQLYGQSVVIFSDFQEPLNIIEQRLTAKGVSYTRLVSEDNPSTRYNRQQDFKAGTVKVFMTTYKCGGVGIDLTPCSNLILNDSPYTPADKLQAEDRCHRIGQIEDLTVHIVTWQDPSDIEGKLESILHEKQDIINVLNDDDMTLEVDCIAGVEIVC